MHILLDILIFSIGQTPGTGSLVGCRLWGHTVGRNWSDLAAAAAVTWIYFCGLQEKIGSVWPPRGQPCSSDLLCDEAKLWRMGGRLSGSTWHLQAGPSASLQQSVLSLSSPPQAAAVLPWKKIHQEENGARGSESAWGVTGGTPCRTHLLWTQFMFRVRKYNSRLVTWALLSHLQDVTCRVIWRTGSVTQQAMTWHHFLRLLLARMWSSCPNPTAKKGQGMHASCVQRKEKGQFPISYIQQQPIPTPHTSSLYLTLPPFFFPIALLLDTLRGWQAGRPRVSQPRK